MYECGKEIKRKRKSSINRVYRGFMCKLGS